MSDSNGNPVFIGIQDTTAEITSLVFDLTMTGCASLECGNSDFAVDTLISSQRPTPRRSPTLRHRPRCSRSARLAQEAEGCGHRIRLIRKPLNNSVEHGILCP